MADTPAGTTTDHHQPADASASLRVLVVDDHALVRSGVRSELTAHAPDLDVIAEADDVEGAIAAVHALRPDVVLLDVHLPGGNGGGGAARGYVTKAISTEDLAQAVRRVAAGDAAFSPRLAGFVLDAFGAGAGEVAVADTELDRLSAREREVMRLIARGYTYKECASELFISVKTVETHVSAVLRKLQLSNRNELTRWAVARRIV